MWSFHETFAAMTFGRFKGVSGYPLRQKDAQSADILGKNFEQNCKQQLCSSRIENHAPHNQKIMYQSTSQPAQLGPVLLLRAQERCSTGHVEWAVNRQPGSYTENS